MTKLTITLTKVEISLLQEKMQTHQREWKVLRRLRCILMRHEGSTLKEIRTTLAVSDDAIATWCKLYRSKGIDALLSFQYDGRRFSVLEPYKAKMLGMVENHLYNTYAEFLYDLNQQIKAETGKEIPIKWDGFVKFCKKNFL